jgi:hypothetical protein
MNEPDLEAALDGLIAATNYAESIGEDDLAIELGRKYQELSQVAPTDEETEKESEGGEDPNPVNPDDPIFTDRPSFSSAGPTSGKSAEEYTEEQLLEAEQALNEALRTADNPRLRGQLLGAYRDIIGMQFRYYDDGENEPQSGDFDRSDRLREHKQEGESFTETILRLTGENRDLMKGFGAMQDVEGFREAVEATSGDLELLDAGERIDDKPEVCPVCGNDYVHMGNAPMGTFTLNKSDAPTCFKVAEDGLRHIHHSEENGPDMSLP